MSLLSRLLVVAACFFFLTAWSIPEAHLKANDVLVRVGTWCSGTVIDKKRGLVVTAAHCVSPMKRVTKTSKEMHNGTFKTIFVTSYDPVALTLDGFNDEGFLYRSAMYRAELVGQDEVPDVAILRIVSSKAGLNDAAKLSKVPCKFGDVIYTIGNPLLIPGAVSHGYVLQPRVRLAAIGDVVAILFSAHIDRGSSGGGLYNDSGELIGITNWMSPTGIEKLASPISNVVYLMKRLGL